MTRLLPPLALWIRAGLIVPLVPAFWLIGWELGAHFAALTVVMTLLGGVLTRLVQLIEPRLRQSMERRP